MEHIHQRLASPEYQKVRLMDVFILAPAMVYASTYKEIPDLVRLVLFVSGICTLLFNANNYLEIEENKHRI